MKLKFSIFLFLYFSVKSLACVCNIKPEFKTLDDLQEYSFIAHIKIKDISKASLEPNDFHQMSFDIIELYKGDSLSTISVYGSHPLLSGWTSCDLGEMIGDEWIIFGSKDQSNAIFTGHCTRSKRIKNNFGYENNNYPAQLTLKDKLQSIFGKVKPKPTFEGKRITHYNNGTKQLEENYLNGKLDGLRNLWYPNAILESTQNYYDGKKAGTFRWYSSKGDLTKIEKFRDDTQIDTMFIWREIDTSYISLKIHSDLNQVTLSEAKTALSRKSLWIERVYDNHGNMISDRNYHQNGQKDRESLYSIKEEKVIVRYFHENGVLSSEMHTQKGINIGIYKEWDENGNLKTEWEFDEKGNAKKETVRRY